jgi:ribosomal-protein-alanine N-acetyltransferase
MVNLDLAIRVARSSDESRLSNLLYFESYVHRHLDWRTPLDWLGAPEYWVAEQGGLVNAALACPPDPENVAWIRLFAHSNAMPGEEAWHVLWETAKQSFSGRSDMTVAAIVLHDWFQKLLQANDFTERQKIVLLEHTVSSVYERPVPLGVSIRPMQRDDLPAVTQLDLQAFDPIWRNSLSALQRAFSQSGSATIAIHNGQVVGYQISTRNSFGVHLARLAVSPVFRGQGLGYAIVQDLLRSIRRMGILKLTVNTQSDNAASLSLYHKIGFVLTGESYPVYTYQIH